MCTMNTPRGIGGALFAGLVPPPFRSRIQRNQDAQGGRSSRDRLLTRLVAPQSIIERKNTQVFNSAGLPTSQNLIQ